MTKSNTSIRIVQISVVLPAYNEVNYLQPATEKTIQTLKQFTKSYEIIIAEDGSTDGTAEKAKEITEKNPNVKYIHRDQRLGRGTALNNAFKLSSGQVLVYMDLDLATDLKYLKPLVEAITVEGFDFSTGSRMLAESKAERTISRSISSKTYKLRDHQCGFKAFKREPLMELLNEVKATHWFWDTEIMVRAHRHGFKIKEIAVEWKSGKDTKVNLIKDSWNMFWQIVRLWWKLKIQNK
jgi:glycosyltransferase involved in cell wall biosynthesis